MASRYWVGGTESWNATAGSKWALTSGGSGGQAVPTNNDDVFFDANSGAVTVTVSSTSTCKDLNFTGFTGTFAGSSSLAISGSLTMGSGMTNSYSGSITFNSGLSETLGFNGKTMNSTTTFNGVGTWELQDEWNNSTKAITLSRGTLTTSNNNISSGNVSLSGSNAKTLNLGSSSWAISGSGSFSYSGSNLTLNEGTSTITISSSSGSRSFSGGGETYYNVVMTGQYSANVSGVNIFNNLTITGAAGTPGNRIVIGSNQTINGTLTLSATSGRKSVVTAGNGDYGTQVTLTAAAATLTNVNLMDIIIAGAAAPVSGTSLGDGGNNSGITFGSAVTRYWVGNGGNFNDTSHWSTSSGGSSGASVPLCHDIAVFDSNSFSSGSQTVTMNITWWPQMTFTGVTNSPSLSVASLALNTTAATRIIGDLTLYRGMTFSSTGDNSLLVFGDISAVGVGGNVITISDVDMSKQSGTVEGDYLHITDSIVMGGATWYAGDNSTDNGGNSGWLFYSPAEARSQVTGLSSISNISSIQF